MTDVFLFVLACEGVGYCFAHLDLYWKSFDLKEVSIVGRWLIWLLEAFLVAISDDGEGLSLWTAESDEICREYGHVRCYVAGE